MTDLKQKYAAEKAWQEFKDKNEPVGQAKYYYKDNGQYFKSGFNAALELAQKDVDELVKTLKECKDYIQDQLARTNKAIETDCPQCDYQCEGCIHSIDDTEAIKKVIGETLSKWRGEK